MNIYFGIVSYLLLTFTCVELTLQLELKDLHMFHKALIIYSTQRVPYFCTGVMNLTYSRHWLCVVGYVSFSACNLQQYNWYILIFTLKTRSLGFVFIKFILMKFISLMNMNVIDTACLDNI